MLIAGIVSTPIDQLEEALKLWIGADETSVTLENRNTTTNFANCCIILIKNALGEVSKFAQLKLRPSPHESTLPGMLCGEKIYFFSSIHFSFSIIICSDLICTFGNPQKTLPLVFVESLQQAWRREDPPLTTPYLIDALINIQCNPKPNNNDFRQACDSFLSSSCSEVMTDKSCIIFANWGCSWDKQEPILSSALVFPKNVWCPPALKDKDIQQNYSLVPYRAGNQHKLNIAGFRFAEGGRFLFRMRCCRDYAPSNPLCKLPFESDFCFEEFQASSTWNSKRRSAWHDRCWRWLPEDIQSNPYKGFWDTPNSSQLQNDIPRSYREFIASIQNKDANDLKHNCNCLIQLHQTEPYNPDLWDIEQNVALNKWASLGTIFHHIEPLGFKGNQWMSFTWREKIYLSIMDGGTRVPSAKFSRNHYLEQYAKYLPLDPQRNYRLLLILTNHTKDGPHCSEVEPFYPNNWTKIPAQSNGPPGVRPQNDDQTKFTKPRLNPSLFWCCDSIFDEVRQAPDTNQMKKRLEACCAKVLA